MIEHIKLGVNEVFYYNYEGEALPLRPISSYEIDESIFRALKKADPKIAEFVVKIKLGLLGMQDTVKIDSKSYADLKKYYNSIDYWFVYHAMKDFQDESFSKTNFEHKVPEGFLKVKKMNYVHDIAKKVLNYSYQPKEVVKEIVKTKEGKVIAKIVFFLNQPLSSNFGDLTKLQRDFLLYSKLQDSHPRSIQKSGEIRKLKKLVGNVDSDR